MLSLGFRIAWYGYKRKTYCDVRGEVKEYLLSGLKYKGAYTMRFLHVDFTDMGMQLSHCIHVMIILRWNSSSKQEWIWESLLVFFMLNSNSISS